jgi:hypothetical protein
MVHDRPIRFEVSELDFSHAMQRVRTTDSGPAPREQQQRRGVPIPGRRWPL